MSHTSHIPNILATDFVEPVAILTNVSIGDSSKKKTQKKKQTNENKAKQPHCYSVVRKICV